MRELVIEVTGQPTFVGTADEIARAIDEFVQSDAADGFVFVPHPTPTGPDEPVDRVIPPLREKGVFRTDCTGATLRDHLGLKAPRAKETS
ncbi:hypothetical protein [Embleya sp. NPDC001921]